MLCFGIWGMLSVQTLLQIYLAVRMDAAKNGTRKRRRGHHHHRVFKSSVTSRTSTINTGHFNLNVILSDKMLSKAFEDHLQKEFGGESLFFYQEATAYANGFRDMSPSTRAARARKITKTFIRSDGIFCINIPSSVSRSIINVVDTEPFVPYRELFDEAIEEIRELLEIGALSRFKHTAQFKLLMEIQFDQQMEQLLV